jgi:hypothetical protein
MAGVVLFAPLGTRLFTASLLYAVTMGWQPLVATLVVRRRSSDAAHSHRDSAGANPQGRRQAHAQLT